MAREAGRGTEGQGDAFWEEIQQKKGGVKKEKMTASVQKAWRPRRKWETHPREKIEEGGYLQAKGVA